MYTVFEGEMLHHRRYLAERIENLSHGRYLPVKVPAVDIYRKGIHLGLLTRVHLRYNAVVKKLDITTVEPEVLCCVHKLQEKWDRKGKVFEEQNVELLEARGDDPTDKRFQVGGNTSEKKLAEVRKRDLCRDWTMHELPLGPLYITVGNRVRIDDPKRLQLGHG
jgi:hypothetical protein